MDSFEQFVRGGLAQAGMEASEAEVQVMRYVDGLYGGDMRALEAADLSAEFAEADLDPGRPPNPVPRA